MKDSHPKYVYNLNLIKERMNDFKKLDRVTRVNYALKANNHPEVVQTLSDAGSCFDCVSINEVEYLQKQLPGFSVDRVVFTPNFAPIEEYKKALELGCYVTLDNIFF